MLPTVKVKKRKKTKAYLTGGNSFCIASVELLKHKNIPHGNGINLRHSKAYGISILEKCSTLIGSTQ